MVFLDLSGWWQALTSLEKIFWVIALIASSFFLIQLIMSFTGGDSDTFGDADDYVGADDGIGHQFFTIKNMIAFFTIFGWTGIALIKGGMSTAAIIGISVAAGSVVVLIMALLFKGMHRLKQSGTLKIQNAIGAVAETYLHIPANRGGFGKVHVKVQGSLHELQAITDDTQPIATGKLVKIIGVVNDSVLVVTSDLS